MTVIAIGMKSKFQTLCRTARCVGVGPGMAAGVPAALLPSASDLTTLRLRFLTWKVQVVTGHRTCHGVAVRAT